MGFVTLTQCQACIFPFSRMAAGCIFASGPLRVLHQDPDQQAETSWSDNKVALYTSSVAGVFVVVVVVFNTVVLSLSVSLLDIITPETTVLDVLTLDVCDPFNTCVKLDRNV